MTKLEELTKALLKRRFYDCEPEMYESEEHFWSMMDPDYLAEVREEVVAVLGAIRRPSEEMKFVGGLKFEAIAYENDPDGTGIIFSDMGTVFTTMIDHLLSEAGESA